MVVKDQGEKVIRTVCPHQNGILCGLLAHVKDGMITKIEPADDYPDPGYRNACTRAYAMPKVVHHPDRLKYPMKRVGERGEGKWQRISWDEALDTIASKFNDIGERYGPASVAYISGGLCFPSGGLFASQRFASATGGTFVGLLGISTSAAATANASLYGAMYTDYANDHDDPDMIVLWGENMLETWPVKYSPLIPARDRGARMVYIGPLFNITAAKADEWIPIRPGTDTAMILGMINVILSEDICDKPFITKYTNGPFLVRRDNGLLLREKHLSSGEKTSKYMVWDTKTNKPQTYNTPGVVPALRGSYTVDGIECKTALQLLAELAEQYPLEEVSEITGVDPDSIRKLAIDYTTRRPVASYKGLGLQRLFNGHLTFRAIDTLVALTGNTSMRPWMDFFSELDFPSYMFPEMRMFTPLPIIQFYEAAITGEPYPIKAMWVSTHNPGDSHGNRGKFREAMKNLEFIVALELFVTSTAEYADIVLPGCSPFEFENATVPWGSYTGGRPYFQVNAKVIEPYYESKTDLEIFNELAPRMGVGEFFNKSVEEYIEDLFSEAPPPLKGLTLEKLKEGPIRHPRAERIFTSPSGRIELYVETMKEFGEELPIFMEPQESARQPIAQKYPLTIFNTHSKFRYHSTLVNVDLFRELEPEPTLSMNMVDAEKRGIKDGDIVTAFNDRGSVTLKAEVHGGMRPGCVSILEGWWVKDFIKGSHNELTASVNNPAQEATVETVMQMQAIMCEVKKAEEE